MREAAKAGFDAVEADMVKQEAMNTELYAAIATRPWVKQANAPADTSLIWFDTDQVADAVVVKIHNGTTWVQQAIGESGSGISHATSDGNYYASRNGAWASLTGLYAPALGADDHYVTAAEKTSWNAKQAALVSGTNIKTINSTSLLGSGDISISGTMSWPTSDSNYYAAYNGAWTNISDVFTKVADAVEIPAIIQTFMAATTASGARAAIGAATIVASGTTALGTTTIASGTCATVISAPATGVVAGAPAVWGPTTRWSNVTGYAPTTSGWLRVDNYQTDNAVNFEVCNYTGASITPGEVSIRWQVLQ